MNIVTDYNLLSERSDEIEDKKENKLLRKIITELKEVVKENNLTGLAAPQLGYNKRVFVVNFKGKLTTYVNPVITSAKNMGLAKENCPSFPDKMYLHPRYSEVIIVFQNPLGKATSQKLLGLAAIVCQELCDHLDGLVLPDIGLEIDDLFDKASQEEQDEVIKAYLESLDMSRKELQEEIEQDPDAKTMSDAIRFMESVRSGETKIQVETVKV